MASMKILVTIPRVYQRLYCTTNHKIVSLNKISHHQYSTDSIHPVNSSIKSSEIKSSISTAEEQQWHEKDTFNHEEVKRLLGEIEGDEPIANMNNPYKAKQRKCILCTRNVYIDYKNVELLSQFVSQHSGRILPRNRTGLCIPMQNHISRLIQRARTLAFMPYMHKDPEYIPQPKNIFIPKNDDNSK
ncbi:30S ribosomal protein S18 [Patella vulgata]|uniref:30S ribosomal protein S18 n=1 Tax=Patella vulgata TaxID=6465 RepID=UPI00217F71F0|nr:30S ribosomal protein S18 [Patella vulgata]